MASVASQLKRKSLYMRKVTVSRMRERYAQTVLTFRITYVHYIELQRVNPDIRKIEIAA